MNVKPFDGSGYSNWEFRVKLVLEQAGVLEILETDPPQDTAGFTAFKKNDMKARNIIVQCLSDNILEMIKTKTTAKEIMNVLNTTYHKKGISTQVQMQRKLRSLKYVEGTALNIFLTEFEQTVYELKSAGGKMEESEIVLQLLSSIPESFQAVTTAIDIMFCQDESKITLDFVKNKLLIEESRQSKSQEEIVGNEATFLSSKKKWNKNFSKKENERKNFFSFKCHGYGVVGHKKYNCPKNQRKIEKVNVADNLESEGKDTITFLVSSENSLMSFNQNSNEIKFIVDSGATNHLVNKTTGNLLENKTKVSFSINVAKKGETIEASEQGNLRIKLNE